MCHVEYGKARVSTKQANMDSRVMTINALMQNLDHWWERVRSAPGRALLLDYDGTLAPFVVARDEAYPYPRVRELLTAILDTGRSRVVIITGRAANEVVPLLGLQRPVEVWGTHGWERVTPDGEYALSPLPEPMVHALAVERLWLEQRGWQMHGEAKPASLALHWRGLDQDTAAAMRAEVGQRWRAHGPAVGLEIHSFDGGLELRVPGRDKGVAVAMLLDEVGPDAAVAYLGDDVTDEDAFRAIKGRGTGILVRPEARPTAADLWLQPPEQLVGFLRSWNAACLAAG